MTAIHVDVRPPYPAVGEIFELTLDGDDPAVQPLEMLRRDGYTSTWKHHGPVVQFRQTCRFKLVQVGYQPNLPAVRAALAAHGEIPPGQWREALKAAYRLDGQGPVGIADPSWLTPNGSAHFPYVPTVCESYFYWADNDYSEHWRWLVQVGK